MLLGCDLSPGSTLLAERVVLSRSGITVALVTHEPDIAAFATRVIVVKDGRVQTDQRQQAREARS